MNLGFLKSKWIKRGLPVILILMLIGYTSDPDSKNTGDIIRPKGDSDLEIEQFHSSYDCDGDGIDDQVDILQGALEYVEKHPQYDDKYNPDGYTDGTRGACTDVIAMAMKNAGYDLMYLVNLDITENPQRYDVAEPNMYIDFRRVANLKVFFMYHAIPLTTDLSRVEEWQGGDIVVFQDHIGIVSDRRNSSGVPYLIHHNRRFQLFYEEDVLEKRDDLEAHYRITV